MDFFVVPILPSEYWIELLSLYEVEAKSNWNVYQSFNGSYEDNIFSVEYIFNNAINISNWYYNPFTSWYYNPQHTKGILAWRYVVDTVRGVVTEFEAMYGDMIFFSENKPPFLYYKYILTESLEEYVEPSQTERLELFGVPIPFGDLFYSFSGFFLLTMITLLKKRKKDS